MCRFRVEVVAVVRSGSGRSVVAVSDSGVVRAWFGDEGWGVLDCGRTPGGCWVHFSALAVDGYRALVPEQRVELEWEQADQDGFVYRAVRVWPAGEEPVDVMKAYGSDSGAYASSLVITWDEDRPGSEFG